MTDIPIDRTSPSYRQHIRQLAASKRKPRPERKPGRTIRPARASRPYPWPSDGDIGDNDD